ncbi:MAG: sporulation protein YunB [Clostridiaceae bacterium]
MKVEMDNEGNITMLRADTIKLNSLAAKVSIQSQDEINKIGAIGIKFPVGYLSRNNITSSWGPKITVKMEPIGSIKTNYYSEFESAGINQTRHKIYLEVEAKVRVIVPVKNDEVDIKTTIPVAETIIVGRTPQTNLQLGN